MARESEAVRKAREFREQLIRQEDAALREMSRQWVRMENKLTDQYKLLHAEIKEMMERGEAVPLQRIYNLQRYQQMMAEIAKELPEYDAEAVRIITHYQRESYTLGLDAAEAVIMDTRPSDPMWNRVGKDAAQITAGFAGNGAPLGQLLQRDYGDLGVKITDALVEGVALGKGAFATAKDMRDAMGMEYNRSVRIARTEINRAYRIANADQYAKSGVVTKVLRLCAKQANTCLACLMMDGDEVPGGVLDDHPNGRCATIAVTVGGIYPQWEHGDVWFEQQDETTQRAIMGPGRYELWKKDGIDPRQMVMMKPNDVWGGSPTVISERELRERYNLTGGNRMLFSGAQKQQQTQTPKSVLSPEMQKKLSGIDYLPCKDLAKAETQDQIIATLSGGDKTKGSCASVALAYAGRSNGIDVRDFRDGKSREWFASKPNKREMAAECGISVQNIVDFAKTGWEKLKSANLEDGVDYLLGYACHMAVIHRNGAAYEYLELQSSYRNGWNKLNASELKSRFGAGDSGRYYAMDIYDVRTCIGDKFKEMLGFLNTEPGKENKGKGGTIK